MLKKRIIAVILAALVTMMSTNVVYAGHGYDRHTGFAGNIYIICEVGFNENSAYAYVQANDYVDARMSGYALFVSGRTKVMSGGFEQNTYGGIGVSDSFDVMVSSCEFIVSGDVDDYRKTGFAD